jgi:hypothetical protein
MEGRLRGGCEHGHATGRGTLITGLLISPFPIPIPIPFPDQAAPVLPKRTDHWFCPEFDALSGRDDTTSMTSKMARFRDAMPTPSLPS